MKRAYAVITTGKEMVCGFFREQGIKQQPG